MSQSRIIAIAAVMTVIAVGLFLFFGPSQYTSRFSYNDQNQKELKQEVIAIPNQEPPVEKNVSPPVVNVPPREVPRAVPMRLPPPREKLSRGLSGPKHPKNKLARIKKRPSQAEELEALATGEKISSVTHTRQSRRPAQVEVTPTDITDDEWLNRPKTNNVAATEAVETVNRFTKALLALESGKNPDSVEFVYRIGQRAAADLMFVEKKFIDEHMLNGIKFKMKKLFHFERDGLFIVYPNHEAFFKLAEQNGNLLKDTSFFRRAMDFTRDGRHTYSTKRTEFYDCVEYGSGQLTKAYQSWTDYQVRFPNSYASFVQDEIFEATQAFKENKCACGNEKGIEKEFKKFSEVFPNSPLKAVLDRRLSQLAQKDQEEFRLKCKGF